MTLYYRTSTQKITRIKCSFHCKSAGKQLSDDVFRFLIEPRQPLFSHIIQFESAAPLLVSIQTFLTGIVNFYYMNNLNFSVYLI